eukprot:XP_028334808.1 lymphocyte-specific protein 1 isoform X10 [Physeter catodon]
MGGARAATSCSFRALKRGQQRKGGRLRPGRACTPSRGPTWPPRDSATDTRCSTASHILEAREAGAGRGAETAGAVAPRSACPGPGSGPGKGASSSSCFLRRVQPPSWGLAFPRLRHRRRHLLAPDPRAQGRGRPDERPPPPTPDPAEEAASHGLPGPQAPPTSATSRSWTLRPLPLTPSSAPHSSGRKGTLAVGWPKDHFQRSHKLPGKVQPVQREATCRGLRVKSHQHPQRHWTPHPPRLQPSTLCSKLPPVSPCAGSLGLTDGGGPGSRARWKGHPPCTVAGPRPLAFRFGHSVLSSDLLCVRLWGL